MTEGMTIDITSDVTTRKGRTRTLRSRRERLPNVLTFRRRYRSRPFEEI